MSTEKKKKFIIDVTYLALILVLSYLLLQYALPLLLPFVLAFLIAYVLRRPIRFLSRVLHAPKGLVAVLLVVLTYGTIGLLLALAQNARRVLNREQLLALTHNESTEVFDRTIDVLIMRLRRKIELNPHQPTLIKTLRGLGYVFSADVTHSDKAA